MRSKLLHQVEGLRSFVVVLKTGDRIRESLGRFAETEGLSAARLSAIGAFERAKLRFFVPEKKEYEPIPVEEQVEVVSLNGDITLGPEGKRKLHLHAMLGRRDGSALGGDLEEATVRPTLEVMITETPAHLRRQEDPETGLPLIRIED